MTGIGRLCVIAGAFLIVFGFAAFSVEYAFWRSSAGVMVVLGFVLAIAGAILLSIEKAQQEGGAVVLKTCPKCRKQYSGREIEYCPSCGVKLEQLISPTVEGRGQVR